MNAYEEILRMMRAEGRKGNAAPIQEGIMDGPSSCSIGKLKLSGGDLLIAEHLRTGYQKDKETHVGALQAGDKVAVYRLDKKRYAILERLV